MARTILFRDLPIRLAGLMSLAVAAACLWLLFSGPASRGVIAFAGLVEAVAGFLGASIGLALLMLGRHIHDRIPVSSPWL